MVASISGNEKNSSRRAPIVSGTIRVSKACHFAGEIGIGGGDIANSAARGGSSSSSGLMNLVPRVFGPSDLRTGEPLVLWTCWILSDTLRDLRAMPLFFLGRFRIASAITCMTEGSPAIYFRSSSYEAFVPFVLGRKHPLLRPELCIGIEPLGQLCSIPFSNDSAVMFSQFRIYI